MKLLIKDIKKNFSDKVVLTGATYTFKEDIIYGLLGKNGAGKTTLFNIIYDEVDQDEGLVQIEEDGKLRDITFEDVGMVFAETLLPEFLTAYEYIKFIFDITNEPKEYSIDQYFDLVDIDKDDRHRLIKGYSSGMKSKLAMVAIYIQNPKIILLDEPLTAVDVISGQEIKKFIKKLKKDHIIILSTHMMDLAKDISDEIVILNEGKLRSLENLQKDENFEDIIIEALKETDHV
ncbi:MAG: ATP-binding cassette domain-containing protein [Anaerococcus sp.]|nr:ATP-binding cassette domain-containing protein [Peptoniphilaceae bacterium]MDY3055075.1 ATP-binding cassette domain-containing protein [Anaerococcus sp.]